MAEYSGSKQEVVRRIKRLRRAGKPLNYSAMRRTDNRLLVLARDRFGSWRAAVQAAKLDYEKICRVQQWSKKKIRDQLRELYRRRAFSNIRSLSVEYPKLYGACCRHFGGGLAALRAVGIDYDKLLSEQPDRWTKKKILDELKRRYAESETLCRAVILREEPSFKRFCYAVMHQFGSWGKALRAAGLDPEAIRNRDGKWPRAKVLEAIRLRHKKRKLLNTDRMLREDLALHAAGRRYFGTWKKAVEAAGIDYNQHVRGGLRGWTKPRTRRAIRDRIRKNRGSRKQVQDQTPLLYRAAMHHFGSWEEAVRTARRRK